MSIKIKKVNKSEVYNLLRISKQTFIDTFSKYNTKENMNLYLSKSFTYFKIKNELNNNNSSFYFLTENNLIKAYLKINLNYWNKFNSKGIEIERIYVSEKYHKKGYGKLLISKAINIAKKYNSEYIFLGVWEHNINAINFYKKFGFEEFSYHNFILGNDIQKDLLMKRKV